jgi:hypothetical protein
MNHQGSPRKEVSSPSCALFAFVVKFLVPFVIPHISMFGPSKVLDNYGGQFPVWVITELFTFGMLSYFYGDLPTPDQKRRRDVYDW